VTPKLATLQPRIGLQSLAIGSSATQVLKAPRLRGEALQKRRARWFAEHPLCVHCEAKGKVSAATELDHILPVYQGGADDLCNLQGLCNACHAVKTRADMQGIPGGVS
jgi:5-methylcytosine-specific restriction protein A